jgi:hypothetical protein
MIFFKLLPIIESLSFTTISIRQSFRKNVMGSEKGPFPMTKWLQEQRDRRGSMGVVACGAAVPSGSLQGDTAADGRPEKACKENKGCPPAKTMRSVQRFFSFRVEPLLAFLQIGVPTGLGAEVDFTPLALDAAGCFDQRQAHLKSSPKDSSTMALSKW